MSGYNFKVEGLDKFIKAVSIINSGFPKDLQRIIEKHGGKMLRDTKKKTPVDTGQLRRSWQLEKGDLYVRVFSNCEYNIYVEYGHRTRGGKSYVEGVYMLKTSFEKAQKDFIEDLNKQVLKKYGFK